MGSKHEGPSFMDRNRGMQGVGSLLGLVDSWLEFIWGAKENFLDKGLEASQLAAVWRQLNKIEDDLGKDSQGGSVYIVLAYGNVCGGLS